MIENDHQLFITRIELARFENALEALQANTDSVDPILRKAQLESVQSQIDDLSQQIRDYQNGTNPQGEGYGLVGVWNNLKHAARSILHPPSYEERGRSRTEPS